MVICPAKVLWQTGRMLRICLFLMAVCLFVAPVYGAEETSDDFPRQASLRDNEVNVRTGPGKRYPILWVFQRKGWPVAVLAEYQNWYKIRDLEGEEGWIYKGIVSRRETAVAVEGEPTSVFYSAEMKESTHKLEPGVVVGIEACGPVLCEVSVKGDEGWVLKEKLRQPAL